MERNRSVVKTTIYFCHEQALASTTGAGACSVCGQLMKETGWIESLPEQGENDEDLCST